MTPLKHIAPTRYYSHMVDLTFWQALRRFVKHGFWSWQKVEWEAVYKGDPLYESAPYEERIIKTHVVSGYTDLDDWMKGKK